MFIVGEVNLQMQLEVIGVKLQGLMLVEESFFRLNASTGHIGIEGKRLGLTGTPLKAELP